MVQYSQMELKIARWILASAWFVVILSRAQNLVPASIPLRLFPVRGG